jgi:hypothetical protein
LCFGVVVWFFGAVFGWAFGCQRACGVCSRLLEMADVSPLSHDVGEGLGVRAKNANASHAVNLRNHAGSYSFFLNSGFSSLSDLM